MATGSAEQAGQAGKGASYVRHRPEQTLLYRLVKEHYPRFLSALAERGECLPRYVDREFEAYLECGCLEHGGLRLHCESCHREHHVAFSCKRRGFCPSRRVGRCE